MKLDLAIVTDCFDNGCDVHLCLTDQALFAHYSPLVKDQIPIQPDQLVVLDMSVEPAEIVWRWLRGPVIEYTSETIIVDDLQGHPAVVILVPKLPLSLKLGDEVWTCGTGTGFEIHDQCINGHPAHPARLLTYITPLIKQIYQR